jgi:hypothetical protein
MAQLRTGVEHEYRLWAAHGLVDFRRLIEEVAGQVAPLDPGDPRARRLPSGVALTADGHEAELATPPLPVERSTPLQVDMLLRSERTELRDVAAAHGVTRLTGFSTHVNVSVEDDLVVPLGRELVERCSAALAAVTEPPESWGIFVRPRRGRLEIGSEYVEGRRLQAAITLACSCVAALLHDTTRPVTAPVRSEPSREKFGWFVPRQDHGLDDVARIWAWARPWCLNLDLDPGPVDTISPAQPGGQVCTYGPAPLLPQPTCGPRSRPGGIRVTTEWLTWQHAVWCFEDRRGRQVRAVVASAHEGDFLAALDEGDLDESVDRLLRTRSPRRRLLVNAQLSTAPFPVSLWHDVRPGALVPAERRPDGKVPRVSRRDAARDLRRLRATA